MAHAIPSPKRFAILPSLFSEFIQGQEIIHREFPPSNPLAHSIFARLRVKISAFRNATHPLDSPLLGAANQLPFVFLLQGINYYVAATLNAPDTVQVVDKQSCYR